MNTAGEIRNQARVLSRAYKVLLDRLLYDWSYSPVVRFLVPLAMYIYYHARYRNDPTAFSLVLAAHRYSRGQGCTDLLARYIKHHVNEWAGAATCSIKPSTVSERTHQLLQARSIVLKAPVIDSGRVLEKGVILVAGCFREFFHAVDVEKMLCSYTLVLEPNTSGHANPDILLYAAFTNHPVLVMCADDADYAFLDFLGTNLIPIRLSSSDWVNPNIFRPIDGVQKQFDAVMVAFWGRTKRHHILFRALRDMRDPSFRVALVGEPWEGTRDEIELLAQLYRVRKQVTIFERLSPSEVNMVLNHSKVNLLLSFREGGNKAIMEGMFANVPALVYRGLFGINRGYINKHTGSFVSEAELPAAMRWFRDHYRDFSPREWALSNVSPELSTSKLNAALKEVALKCGERWTVDIVAKCKSPELQYYPDPSVARGLPTIKDILREYSRW